MLAVPAIAALAKAGRQQRVRPAPRRPAGVWPRLSLGLAWLRAPLLIVSLWTAPAAAQQIDLVGCDCPPATRTALEDVLTQALSNAEDLSPRVRAERLESVTERFLRSQGYLDVSAVALPAGETIRLEIEAGRQYGVGAVTVTPAQLARPSDSLDLQAVAETHLPAGSPARAEAVLDTESELISALHESGFVTAEIGPRDAIIRRSQGVLDVHFRFTPGVFATLGAPHDPSGRLDDRLLSILQTWETGEPARRSELASFVARVEALESVQLARLTFAEDEPVDRPRTVLVDITSEAPHRVEGALGYSSKDGAGAQGRYLRRNLFGRDERLELSTQISELESFVAASVLLPHFRTYGRMLEIDASFSDSRTDAYDAETLEATVGVSQEISGLFQRNVGPISTSAGVGVSTTNGRDLFGPLETTLVFASLSGGIDRRDDTLDSKRGFLLGLEIQPAYAFEQLDGAFARLLAEVRAYRPLGPLVLGARLRTGSLVGSSARAVPPDYRFYAGGGGSVRGYAYQSLSPTVAELEGLTGARGAVDPGFEYFGGDSLFEGTLEARWRPEGRRIGYVAFLDGGTATLTRLPDISQLRYGAGIGVRYYTDFGPLRVDLAAPLDPRADDDPVQIYISIGQAF